MKISVLSTFYNDKEMLKRVMDSVLMQTYADVEHLVVDAASTDGSVELLKEYEKKYVESNKVLKWISEPDNGIYYGFNKAFEMSTGDYVMINAPDPYADNQVFSDLSSFIEKDKPDYVYGGIYFQKNGVVVRRWDGKPGNWRLGWAAASPSLCVKRSVLEKISMQEKYGLFDPERRIAADYKLQVHLFMDKTLKSCSLDRMMAIYYAGGVSNSGLKGYFNSTIDSHRALIDCGVKFSWFIIFCRILRTLFSFVSASHEKIENL